MTSEREGNAKWETGRIPPALREEVLERDNHSCRMCGAWASEPAIHHSRYRSEGGLNVLENLITVHWMFEPRCHEKIHSVKRLWQPLALEVVNHPGVTMLQLKRWSERKEANGEES